jgi:hypothetical protein
VWEDEGLEEELFWETPLDGVDLHGGLKQLLGTLATGNPTACSALKQADYEAIVSALSVPLPVFDKKEKA